jgi:hypothetical protein
VRKRAVGALLALTTVASIAGVAPARADEPVEEAACEAVIGGVPEVGSRACKTLGVTAAGAARTCRIVPGTTPELCAVDGRVVGEAAMAAYEGSWVHRALTLQRALDDAAPFTEATLVHTHNTFNSSAYDPTLTNLDPNQVLTIGDQLRLDVRAIELDLHWAPSVHAQPGNGGKAVVLCHGRTEHVGSIPVHVGCSIDRPFVDGLREVRAWIDANPGEIVLLYLENQLDGESAAHDEAAATIASVLGDLVARPPAAEPCAPMPVDTSRAALRASGARVLIVGNCGPGAWGTWVHERGPRWHESSSPTGDDYPHAAGCEAERAAEGYGTNVIRRYEDSTWVSAMAGLGGELTAVDAARMARCGVNLIGFDQLTPADERLAAVVWSWAPDEPVASSEPACAYQGGDGRFRSAACGELRPFACTDGAGTWTVTSTTGPWGDGDLACATEWPGTTFAVPANGYRNGQLRVAAGDREPWLDYRTTAPGTWTVSPAAPAGLAALVGAGIGADGARVR